GPDTRLSQAAQREARSTQHGDTRSGEVPACGPCVASSSRPSVSLVRGGFRENRVSTDVDPIVLLGWHVTQLAVGLVVRRHVLLWVLRLEQGPPPPISPQVVLGKPFLRVLDHHEPDLDVFSPGGLPRGKLLRTDGGDVLHQDGTVGELAVPAVRL